MIKNSSTGEIEELRCSYDPETRGGQAPDGRKVKGTIHWVSAKHAIPAEIRLYSHLFTVENPAKETDISKVLNPHSLEVIPSAMVEPEIARKPRGFKCQFERVGYFTIDSVQSSKSKLIINRTVTLRDSWNKIKKKGS